MYHKKEPHEESKSSSKIFMKVGFLLRNPAEFQLAVHCMIYRVAQDVLSLKEMQLTMLANIHATFTEGQLG